MKHGHGLNQTTLNRGVKLTSGINISRCALHTVSGYCSQGSHKLKVDPKALSLKVNLYSVDVKPETEWQSKGMAAHRV
jgi:hypothetical protein